MKHLFIIFILAISMSANAFNTNRVEPIIGSLVGKSTDINEIAAFSNTFAFTPKDSKDITKYLNANTNKLLPMIFINHLLFDNKTGVYSHNVDDIVRAITTSKYKFKEIIFTFDEPMWNVRIACFNGVSKSCGDIGALYATTQADIKIIIDQLKAKLPTVSVGIMHVEAYPELVWQKEDWPWKHIELIPDADYVAFDCYGGSIERCGIDSILNRPVGYRHLLDYGNIILEAMLALNEQDHRVRKIMTIPGAFFGKGDLTHEAAVSQLLFYLTITKEYPQYVGGYGVFAWKRYDDLSLKFAKDDETLTRILKFAKTFL